MNPALKETQLPCLYSSDSIQSPNMVLKQSSFSSNNSSSDLAKIDMDKETFAVGEYQLSSCPICLERFTLDNPAVVVGCGHGFHLQCVEDWRQRSPMCPVCMKPVQDEGIPMMFARETRRRRRYKGGYSSSFSSACHCCADDGDGDGDVDCGASGGEPRVVDPMMAGHRRAAPAVEEHFVNVGGGGGGRRRECFLLGLLRTVAQWCSRDE